MKDRLSEKPGRVELRYDDGTTVEVTMTRKDEPAEVGSAYCKANVLPDEVCTLLGIDQVTGEPKDAFQTLKTVTNSLDSAVNSVNSLANTKCSVTTGTYSGNNTASRLISLGFTPRAVFVFAHGTETSYGSNYCYGGLAISQQAAGRNNTSVKIESNGFRVYLTSSGSDNVVANNPNYRYTYIAFV